jgi:uncharacterized membrane protein YfcA
MSLIVVGVASAAGALPKIRAHQVQWRQAGVFAAVGIPATIAGSTFGHHLPQRLVLIGFAVVMVIAGVRMLADNAATGTACEIGDSGINWRRCAPRAIPAGVAVGLLTGLFGVGGEFLIIPVLVVLLGVDMPVAVGTSLLVIAANSAAGVISHLGDSTLNWAVTVAFLTAAVTGSLIAGHLGTKADTARLQHWFAHLVFAVAAYVLIDSLVLRSQLPRCGVALAGDTEERVSPTHPARLPR